jgi:rhamnogalacturonan endolyase
MWEVDLWWNIVLGIWWSPVIVYDLNSDGKAEVVAKTAPTDVDYRDENGRVLTGPEWFTVFDGETGAELATEDWIPRGNVSDWGDSYGNRVNRNMMVVAYLDGVRPSLIIFRGIYEKMVAQAWNFNQDNTLEFLWEWNRANDAGGGFHSIHVGDIDGDGKDEILNGSIAIDDDGTTMWDTHEGHGDRFYLSDIDPDRAGLEVFYIQESPSEYEHPLHLTDAATGALIWGYGDDSYGDVGRGLVGDIDPTHRGVECWSANSTAGLLSCEGVRIAERPSYSGSFVCDFAVWWDDDLLRELTQQYFRLFKYNYTTGEVTRIGTCGGTSMLVGDIVGDWREEIISLHNGEFRVYTPMTVTPHRFYTFMHDPIYRIDVSSSSVGYPQSANTSFYVGDGMAEPPRPQIKVIYGDLTGNNIVDINDLSEFSKFWLTTDCNNVELDFNGDCIINFYEFSLLARDWFEKIQ